ncbi:MAG: hypothetical protein WB760_29565 [Xanthobacteraceae bacterium]
MARNPFRVRASARAVPDDQFIKTFAASAVEILCDPANPWTGLVFVRSAPGGGKTTLLRLLTPGALKRAISYGDDQRYRATRDALQDAGVVDGQRALLWGVYLPFAIEYQALDDLGARSLQVFRALVSARIVLAALKALLAHFELVHPEDLVRLTATWTPIDGAQLPASARGDQLQDWASSIEDSVFELMDELGTEPHVSANGLIELDGLHWLADARVELDGQTVAARPVLLLDDLQYLSSVQHVYLNGALAALRRPLGIWAAERLEAMQQKDLIAPGVLEGRDYDSVIRLEERWLKRGAGPLGRFLSQIADLRARQADGFSDRDFFPAIADDFDSAQWEAKLNAVRDAIEQRILVGPGGGGRYVNWIAQTRAKQGAAKEVAIEWRALEILIVRDLARGQKSFDFDQLDQSELEAQTRSQIREAAELFVCREIGLPYYYGRDRLALLSSSNVDQFVEMSGDLFEEILSASLLRRGDRPLSAERQEAILKSVADRRWEAIPRASVHGHAMLRFLERVGEMCEGETFKPSAPYAPGVTGFAISMADREFLVGEGAHKSDSAKALRDVLASCIALNLLEPRLDAKNKGERWLVLYLNRLLCLRFGLPLGYGGWRPRKIKPLTEWVGKASMAGAAGG